MVMPQTTKFTCNACGWTKSVATGCGGIKESDKFSKCPICDSYDGGYESFPTDSGPSSTQGSTEVDDTNNSKAYSKWKSERK